MPDPVPPPEPPRWTEPVETEVEEPTEATELLDQHGRLFTAAPPREDGRRRVRTLPLRAALRTLLRQRRRLILSVVAVTLGIGYLAGSLSLLHRVDTGLAQQAGQGTEVADLVIEGELAVSSPLEEVRRLVPHSLVGVVENVDGVEAVEPRLESGALLISDGEVVVGLGLTERPLGVNWPATESLNPYTLEAGRAPEGPDDVAIDAVSAASAGVGVGDKIVVAGTDSVDQFTITGIIEPLPSTTSGGESLAAFETETARSILSIATDDNFIAIDVSDGASIEAVQSEIATLLPPGTEVVDRETFLDHRQASIAKSFTLVRALLLGFAGLAVIVGAFTVANSMALLYDHRRRGFALLRLLGGAPRVLITAAAVEAVLAGLVAAVIGVGAGLLIGQLIEMAIGSLGSPIPLGGSPLTWWIPVVAAIVGITVTAATSIRPARRAAATPPLHAVTHSDRDPHPHGVGRWVVRGALIAAAAALGFIGASALGSGPSPVVLAVGAAALTVVLLAIPPVLGALVRATTSLLLRRSTALRRVATATSSGARTRTSATTAALVLAASVVTGLAALSTSFIDSVDEQVETAVLADLVVDSGTVGPSGLTDAVVPGLREINGVEAVSGWRVASISVNGSSTRAAGLDGASALDLFDLGVDDPTLTSFSNDEFLIHESLAGDLGLEVGDTAELRFQSGTAITSTVAGVFDSGLSTLLGNVIIDSEVMTGQETNGRDVMAFVRLENPDDITSNAEVERFGLSAGADSVVPADELIDGRAELLRGFSRVILWMLLFSVALALIGVVNTLQLGINERRRELALLRAVGATPRQVLRLTLVEAAAIAVVGTLCGIALGLVMARGSVAVLNSVGLTTFSVPVFTIAAIGGATVALALISAAIPSLRASRTPMLAAIADDDGTVEAERRRGRRRRSATRPTPPLQPQAAVATPPQPPPSSGDAAPHPPPPSTVADPVAVDESAFPLQEDPPRTMEGSDEQGDTETKVEPAVVPQPEAVSADRSAESSDGVTPDEPSPDETTVTMPATCYNCGNDPLDSEVCVHCGAVQLPAPVGMFSTSPDAPRQATESQPTPTPQPASSAHEVDDIIDATIIPDDAADVHTGPNGTHVPPPQPSTAAHQQAAVPPPPPTSPPPPPSEPAVGHAAPISDPAPSESRSIGSIFDDPVESAARSPFGQFANDPEADASTADPIGTAPPTGDGFTGGPTTPGSPQDGQAGSAFAADPSFERFDDPPPQAPRTSTPPSGAFTQPPTGGSPYGHAAGPTPGSTPYGQPQGYPQSTADRIVGDGHGLAAAVAYLHSPSGRAAETAFTIAGALLSPEEPVRGVVAGTIGGAPAAVVETMTRVIIVADQRYVPVVHTFHLGPNLEVHGRHVGGQASLTFVSGAQSVQIDGIDDVNIAVGLAASVRSSTVSTEF